MAKKFGDKIASKLHENWRKTRLNPDGSFEPRWKKIKDKRFIKKLDPKNLPGNVRLENGVYEIDIANCTYDQLSADWKKENKQAGYVVAEILESGKEYTLDEVGEIIHAKWLERNPWAKGGELDHPFKELSKEQQDKDLDQYLTGVEAKKEELEASFKKEFGKAKISGDAKVFGEAKISNTDGRNKK